MTSISERQILLNIRAKLQNELRQTTDTKETYRLIDRINLYSHLLETCNEPDPRNAKQS